MEPHGPRNVAAALRLFPGREGNVCRLAAREGAFLDMCEELAEAEAALTRLGSCDGGRDAGWDGGNAERAERIRECQGWIARLAQEMAEVLGQAEVIELPTRRNGP